MGQQALTLQLKNYRRFVATDLIAFEPGLTIISGLNGVGKSTLMEAFIFALFGPGLKRGQTIKDIRTDSLNEQVRVECKLFIDDRAVELQANSCESAKGALVFLGNLVCDDLSLDTRVRGLIRSFQTARLIHTKSQYTQGLLNVIEAAITERRRKYQETEERVSETL